MMRSMHVLSFCCAAGLVCAIGAWAAQAQAGDLQVFLVSPAEEQVVLYTVYRGDYQNVGTAIGRLYALAFQKGLAPSGPVILAYLNNPSLVSSQHLLTEVRIPVGQAALQSAGTLGEMTDVKTLQPTPAAVFTKPEGMADPERAYDALRAWIAEQGYQPVDSPVETFLTNAIGGDYGQMKTTISIPVRIAPKK